MKWTINRPRAVAEDDKLRAEVEADSVEEAIKLAAPKLYGAHSPCVGEVYIVHVRVEVTRPPLLPLKSL